MPAGWTSVSTNGNNGAVFNQVFNTSAAITATATLANSATWASNLFLLRLPAGSPTIVQIAGNSGSFTTSFSGTFGGNTTTGNSIIVIVYGVPPSAVPISGTFTDTQGNLYTQLGVAQNGANEYVIAGITANITGAATPTVTFNSTSGVFSGSRLYAAEVSNIAAPTGEPTFIRMVNSQLPESGVTAGSCGSATTSCALAINSKGVVTSRADTAITSIIPVQVFSATTLGGDVAVAATTQTDVMTRTVTMPSSGCPCRAFISYSLYVNTASSGVGYSFWVNDGSANLAGVNTGQSNASSGALTSASYAGYSTVTYANSATITFTLRTEGDHTYTVRAASLLAGSAPNSSFQIAVSASN